MESGQAEKKTGSEEESKRGRIRRLLFDPLEADGFRKSGKVTAERHSVAMARLADDLAYMGDHGLATLRQMLRTKGQGRARDIWPSVATVIGFAEAIQPRPTEELPGLLRWFASVEGPKALHDGTLVETWSYFHRHKRPPIKAKLEIARRSEHNRHKLELFRERMERGSISDEDADWVRRYEAKLAYCRGLVLGDQQKVVGQ